LSDGKHGIMQVRGTLHGADKGIRYNGVMRHTAWDPWLRLFVPRDLNSKGVIIWKRRIIYV